jgi:hypothetical protein
VNFGSQQLGTTGATRAFTLTNTSLRPLAITGFSTGSADFVITNPATGACGTTLASNASCTVNVAFSPKGTAAGTRNATLTATNAAGTQTVALTGTATTAPPQLPATGTPVITPTAARTLQALNAAMGNVADPNGIRSVQFRWFRLPANATAFQTAAIQTTTDTTAPFTASLAGVLVLQCNAYKVGVTVTDNLGHVETELLSAPTTRATLLANGTGCAGQPAPPALAAAAALVATPLGLATAPRPAATPLSAGSVSVAASAGAPLAVSTTVPAGASTVAISVFRLDAGLTRASATRHKSSTIHVATVYRKVGKAKRYVFRLTERKLRHLKPGRYLVQVRVGPSRLALGPAKSRIVTIRRGRATSAR